MTYLTNPPPSGPPSGPPPIAPPAFGAPRDHLLAEARAGRKRLRAGLNQARTLHDLGKRELVRTQRDIRRLQRVGALPDPTEFWQRSAIPRAAVMVEAAMVVVAEEGNLLGRAVDEFMADLTNGPIADWAVASAGKTVVRAAVGTAAAELVAAAEAPASIDALGAWWQQRLRRAATRRALPRLIRVGADTDLEIGRAEMALLDRPPWCHGDRLLSAFEIAHGEIRTQAAVVADDLLGRTTGRGNKLLSPRSRVTIELRG